jgi:hypothetical protein
MGLGDDFVREACYGLFGCNRTFRGTSFRPRLPLLSNHFAWQPSLDGLFGCNRTFRPNGQDAM